jgi:thiamine biosynthesis protein ThiS
MSGTLERLSIQVNGEAMVLSPGTSVAGLIEQLSLDTRKVAVERNREIVPRSTYAVVALTPGDEIEIVHFIGGG